MAATRSTYADQQVEGIVAAGQATLENPVLMGGNDGGGLRRAFLTDANGNLGVTPAANSAVNVAQVGGTNVVTGGVAGLAGVGGNAASGATDAGNPVKVGGVYNSTAIALANGQRGDAQLDTTGSRYVNSEGRKATYSASVTAFTPVATPTDFFNIFGSASKTVRITRIEISGTTSAATQAALDLQLIKRSTAGTLGSAVLAPLTAVPHDSANGAGSATPNTVGTANYTTPGTLVGVVQARKFLMSLSPQTATDFPTNAPLVFDFTNRNEQGIVLRGVAQQLALGFNGGTLPAGTSLDISVTWTEE